jgi:hypothetical protein
MFTKQYEVPTDRFNPRQGKLVILGCTLFVVALGLGNIRCKLAELG